MSKRKGEWHCQFCDAPTTRYPQVNQKPLCPGCLKKYEDDERAISDFANAEMGIDPILWDDDIGDK